MPHTVPFDISILDRVDQELIDALERMIPQLTPEVHPPGKSELERVIASPSNTLFAARVDNRTVGLLTMVLLTTPTGISAWIADVVVDNEARGYGIGEKLVREAIETARKKGAKHVDLSSRPAREAANRLYLRIGFVKRETNYYRYSL